MLMRLRQLQTSSLLRKTAINHCNRDTIISTPLCLRRAFVVRNSPANTLYTRPPLRQSHRTKKSLAIPLTSFIRRRSSLAAMDSSVDTILAGKYPAKAHCKRVATYLKQHSSSLPVAASVIYLESAHTRMNEDNDQESPFRQRRYFYYLTGCELPDSAMIYNIDADRLTLFIPPINPDEVVWSGLPLQPEEALKKYDVDEAKTSDELNSYLNGPSTPKGGVFAINKQVSDKITFLSFEAKDMESLKPAIEECRVQKDNYEIALIRRANEVAERAHRAAAKAMPNAKNESELEALFLQQCVAHGCKKQAYDPIFASGTDAATLHYIKNDKDLTPSQLNILVDAACEKNCYAADITRTYPVNGKFSAESRDIYSLVLKMQKECIKQLKAGVSWEEIHLLAHKIAINGLLELGILRGGSVDEILKARTSAAFLPHGLGHFLGMDTHDCGGHPNYADKDPLFRYLRCRINLPAGSVITVEPGIYFCRFILEPYLKDPVHSKFIDEKELSRYWAVGGVRIEDNVLILDDGIQNLTTVPKEVDEVEKLVAAD